MARSRKCSPGPGTDRRVADDHGQDGGGVEPGGDVDRGGDGGVGRSIDETVRDHLRAAVGGLFVGLPLLWTMEMWEHGATQPPSKLLLLFGLAFVVVVGFNAVSGFRRERTWVELLLDAVQGMGLSIVVAAADKHIPLDERRRNLHVTSIKVLDALSARRNKLTR